MEFSKTIINKKSIKTFIIGFLLTFLMSAIPHLYTNAKPAWANPWPKTTPSPDTLFLQKVKPKLEAMQNSFHIQKQLIPTVSAGSDYDNASAYSVVDLDSGQILASKNLNAKLAFASLTKVMTAIVALDLASPEEVFSVSPKAAAQVPTKVMLRTGEEYTLHNLLEHALISSANDSTQVIKEGIDNKYGQEIFINAMNEKAKVLGLNNSRFTNPQGFDNRNHYSSVEDLSIISAYALKNYPLIAQIAAKEFDDLTRNGADNRFFLNNWNGLLGLYPGASGLKIGNTGNAKFCTIVTAQRAGKTLIAVLLGAPGVIERDLWTAELLDLGFNKMAGLEPVNVTEEDLRAKYASWKYY